MLEIYAALPLGALVIFFARFAAFQEGILEFIPLLVRRVKNDKLRTYLAKPLYACTVCMASVWGSISYLIFIEVNLGFCLVGYCMSLSGLMLILSHILPFDFEEADTSYIHDKKTTRNEAD